MGFQIANPRVATPKSGLFGLGPHEEVERVKQLLLGASIRRLGVRSVRETRRLSG